MRTGATTWTGRKRTGKWGNRMPRIGYRQTPEHRAKSAAAKRGKVCSLETCAKISAGLTGRLFSIEHRTALRVSHKRAWAEGRMRGHPLTAETRAKISTAKKGQGLGNQYGIRHGHTRGHRSSPTYSTWRAMLQRCRYDIRYIDQGITVGTRWEMFVNFLVDMGERPEGKTLDRIDPTRGYMPDNCRWSTWEEQAANRRPAGFAGKEKVP